ncbi:MAG: VWA domain-containing protein [Sphingobacteriales bacterium]|jgi:Ca-activated chloride channel family protein
MFRFEHTILLLVLVLVPVFVLLYWAVIRWKKRTVAKIGDPALVQQLINNYSPARFRWKFIMVVVAFVLGAIGLANLQRADQVAQINRQGVDVMIALDVSKSMLAEDIQPNRLQRAKLLVNKLIDELDNDKIGLVVFAGRAYLQMPLTSDHSAAKMYVNAASTASVPTQGTVIGDALQICNNAFEKEQKKFKAVILISDGEDHDEKAVEIAKTMAEDGVLLHTIGIGTSSGAQIIDPDTKEVKKNADGTPVITRVNEKELMDLALTGNGSFQLLADADAAVSQVIKEIDGMEKKTIKDNSLLNYRSFFPWFLGAAILILILELLYPERKPMAA